MWTVKLRFQISSTLDGKVGGALVISSQFPHKNSKRLFGIHYHCILYYSQPNCIAMRFPRFVQFYIKMNRVCVCVCGGGALRFRREEGGGQGCLSYFPGSGFVSYGTGKHQP